MLLGKIQSDTIEERLGRIWQSNGAIYFISMRQLLESDRKLKTLLHVKYSLISVVDIENSDIEKAVKENRCVNQDAIFKEEMLFGEMMFNKLPNENYIGLTYYVTGYCCRSLVRSSKCEHCKHATDADISDTTKACCLKVRTNFSSN